MTETPIRSKHFFKGIKPSAWEHPADRAALMALRTVPGLDTAIKTFFGATTEKSLKLITLASAVKVSEKQFSRIHKLHLEACEILDVTDIPEIYVAQNPFLNAGAIGMDKPFIVLNSAIVDTLNDEELLGVIAHEIGHILSGHVLYKTLLVLMLRLSTLTLNIPLSGFAIAGIIAALKEWDRKSELSADRAGALATQNPETSIQLLMKMAGGGHIEEMNLGEFIKQAEEYNEAGTLSESMFKLLNIMGQSHPFPVVRVYELLKWVRSGEYDAIMSGNYDNQSKGFYQNVKDAAHQYKEDLRNTVRPAKEIFDDIEENAEKAKQKAKDIFETLFKKGETPDKK